jgi:hypothetical protein
MVLAGEEQKKPSFDLNTYKLHIGLTRKYLEKALRLEPDKNSKDAQAAGKILTNIRNRPGFSYC